MPAPAEADDCQRAHHLRTRAPLRPLSSLGFAVFCLIFARRAQPADCAVETWHQSLKMIQHNNALLQEVSRDK